MAKTFSEIQDELNENRLLRKGVATAFAVKSRNEGKKVEQNLTAAKNALRHRAGDTTEEQVKRLQEGLIEMCDANIALRRQLGALVAICVSGQLLNERTSKQLEQLLKR
jgi:hypothetical protein